MPGASWLVTIFSASIFNYGKHVSTAQSSIVSLGEWLQSDSGQYVRQWEQARIDAIVSDVFGYNAIQLGTPELDLLRANRMPMKAYCGASLPSDTPPSDWVGMVQAEPEFLPFETQSIDLLVLFHGLELTEHPHEVLREVDRVLVPEGRIVLSGFNPWSLWGARNRLPGKNYLPVAPAAQVSLPRLKDWFKLLSFDIDLGHFGCYVPPFHTKKWIDRFSFTERAGNRWWPVCGGVYVVSAIKRVPGMRLLTPRWKARQSKRVAARAAGVALQQNTDRVTEHPDRH